MKCEKAKKSPDLGVVYQYLVVFSQNQRLSNFYL